MKTFTIKKLYKYSCSKGRMKKQKSKDIDLLWSSELLKSLWFCYEYSNGTWNENLRNLDILMSSSWVMLCKHLGQSVVTQMYRSNFLESSNKKKCFIIAYAVVITYTWCCRTLNSTPKDRRHMLPCHEAVLHKQLTQEQSTLPHRNSSLHHFFLAQENVTLALQHLFFS